MSEIHKSFRVVIAAACLAVLGLIILAGGGTGTALSAPPLQGGVTPTPSPRRVPPNDPSRGLVYDGLEPGISGTCRGAFKLRDNNRCTHGPDPAPPGVNIQSTAAPATRSVSAPESVSAIQCDGNGTSGYRTQVMYVRPSDHADRFGTYAASFVQWATGADQIYSDSAAETGGYRRLRFAHDANCNMSILNVVIPATGDPDFNTMLTQLQSQGYNRSDRKYMIFMDANLYCGIGSLNSDDSPGQSNWNNIGPDYARADNSCWTGPIMAHESNHNMGGVQLSAPHTSGGYHCVDEWDRMCYLDSPNYPPMQYICTSYSHDRLFDCNHDDYYSTNPAPGSYLATHWNTANNRFLIAAPALIPLPFHVFFPLVVK